MINLSFVPFRRVVVYIKLLQACDVKGTVLRDGFAILCYVWLVLGLDGAIFKNLLGAPTIL
jgi:hypothetical protein